MIDQRFIVDGNDLKNLPLRASIYARTLGSDSMEMLTSRLDSITKFVREETTWEPVVWYSDFNRSARCLCEQFELQEMLIDASDSHAFDIIVVGRFSQLARNINIIDYLLEDGTLKVPVYCIEEDIIVTSNPDNIKETLIAASEENIAESDEMMNLKD